MFIKNLPKMILRIPKPSIARLCSVFNLLDELEQQGERTISSCEIGKRIGVTSHSIRKDISYLGEVGIVGSGYDVKKLKKHIASNLGLDVERKACVVGLGELGTAFLQNDRLLPGNFRVVAGFDSSINKLETIVTDIPVYPTHEIGEVVKKQAIELAVVAVTAHAVNEIVQRLISGGIKGIINFSSAPVNCTPHDVFVSNIDVLSEFRIVSAVLTLGTQSSQRILSN
jgi:redox-sensing transcriptional repressor